MCVYEYGVCFSIGGGDGVHQREREKETDKQRELALITASRRCLQSSIESIGLSATYVSVQ